MCDHSAGEQIIVTLPLTFTLHYCCVCSPAHSMDPLESYRITLRNLLGATLHEHHSSCQWHYAINMEDSEPDSLVSYFRLDHQELRSLLLASGLAALYGKQFRMNRSEYQSSYSWQQFLVEQSLDGYFDSMTVKKKRHLWIGLG